MGLSLLLCAFSLTVCLRQVIIHSIKIQEVGLVDGHDSTGDPAGAGPYAHPGPG